MWQAQGLRSRWKGGGGEQAEGVQSGGRGWNGHRRGGSLSPSPSPSLSPSRCVHRDGASSSVRKPVDDGGCRCEVSIEWAADQRYRKGAGRGAMGCGLVGGG